MLILTAIPDLRLPVSRSFFFSSSISTAPQSAESSKPQHFILYCYTHTNTHAHTKVLYTHIPRERDGSVTIGKQRLLVTENALLREPGQQSGGEEVVGLRRGLDGGEHGAISSPSLQ